jgi:4a-hydroxytetrahydrobiopterin dehydratase
VLYHLLGTKNPVLKTDETYSDEEVEARLKEELPHWYLENGWIRRKYKTSGWKATLTVVNAVGHLAEAAFHHPDLTVSYAFVCGWQRCCKFKTI